MEPKPKILVVSAHAADYVWRCAGTIASYSARGSKVKILVLTYGVRGESRLLWRQEGATLEKVKAIRKAECEKTAAILGASIESLDYEDFPLILDRERLDTIIKVLRDFRPHIVLTHHSKDLHNFDHTETFEATMRALRCAGAEGVFRESSPLAQPRVYLFEPDQPDFAVFKADTYIDISHVMSKKMEAMQVVESQPHVHKHYEDRARQKGYLARRFSGRGDIEYAEAFEMVYPYVGSSFV